MKKNIMMMAALALGFNVSAQEWVEDSVAVGPSAAAKQVYYSFGTQQKHEADANSWHLAFSVQSVVVPNGTLQATTVRVNNGKNVKVFIAPDSIGVADFNTLDTAGIGTWEELFDSDSTWDIGAFNTGLDMTLPPHQGGPDYGWGMYNANTKDVESKGRVYVIRQGSTFFKKFYFGDLVFDTAFNFTHADLDNSNLTNVEVVKNKYPDRFFAYYDIVNDEIRNLEPPKDEWDVVFIEYYTWVVSPFGEQMQSVPGTLSKKGVRVARIEDVHPDSAWEVERIFSHDIKTIGYDWKTHVGMGVYAYKDSLSFIVDNGNDSAYLVHFTQYSGSATRKMNFKFQQGWLDRTGLTPLSQASNFKVYPNPVTSALYIDAEGSAQVQVMDLQGRTLLQTEVSQDNGQVDMSDLISGLYIIRIVKQNEVYSQRIIKTN